MFGMRERKNLIVHPEQLIKLLRFLHESEEGLTAASYGQKVRYFAQSNGNFIVYLSADQTRRVKKHLITDEIWKNLKDWKVEE